MLTDLLDYPLPQELIAVAPADPRDSARLMVVHRGAGRVEHHRVRDLPALPDALRPGDLLVFNESKVIPAWFAGTRASTGGRVSGLYLHSPAPRQWSVMLEARGSLREGESLELTPTARLVLLTRQGAGQWTAKLESDQETIALLAAIGSPPLPPYIRKQRRALHLPAVDPRNADRYNTVYARHPGSVAAPTAGLHFTPALLDALTTAGLGRAVVTLHVGLGTFAPIRTKNVEDHPIHREWISVPPETIAALAATRAAGGRVIPVGTTTVRALESLPDPLPAPAAGPYVAQTDLFITPGIRGTPGIPGTPGNPPFNFRFTDALMTNFHLPRSSLLALVAALPEVGVDRLMTWYHLAIQNHYRFYSYGDAMLLL